MESVRDQAISALQTLPESASLDDVRHQIYLLEKLNAAENDIAHGQVYTIGEAHERVDSWLESSGLKQP
ncbi:MAG: hypothetical protein RIF32_05005 [Leptospirales bacterium]|jgi:hypothetical protein